MTISTFDGSGLPARRTVIGSVVGALAGGALLGLVIGVLDPSGPEDGKLLAGATTSPTSSAATQPATSSPGASPSRSAKPKPVKTVTRPAAQVPGQFIQHPETDKTLSLGILESMDASNHDHVIVYIRKAKIITGDEAKKFYTDQNQQPRASAVVPLDNVQPQGLVLRPDAALWGQFFLGDHQNVNLRQLQFDEFLQIVNDDLGRNEHPPVWTKRTFGSTGDILYLAEHVITQ